jgi:hypothetical protein
MSVEDRPIGFLAPDVGDIKAAGDKVEIAVG